MSKSIMQDTKECYLCRRDAEALGYHGMLTSEGLDRHHVLFGTANRKLSEKYGVWVWLCKKHHNEDHGLYAVHYNRQIRESLCMDAERAFLSRHSFEEYMDIFGKNYLEMDEINRIKTKCENTLKNANTDTSRLADHTQSENGEKTECPAGFWFIN